MSPNQGHERRYTSALWATRPPLSMSSEREDALCRVPGGALRVVQPPLVTSVRGSERSGRVADRGTVARHCPARFQGGQPLDARHRSADSTGPLAVDSDPGNVIRVHSVPADEKPLLLGVERNVAERVAGRVDDAEKWSAGVDRVPVLENDVDLVRLDGLVEPHGRAGIRVSAIDQVRFPAVGGDGDPEARLQVVVASDVVAVMMGVHDERERGRPDPRLAQQAEGQLGIVAEPAVDEHGSPPEDERSVRAREAALMPPEPCGQLLHGRLPSA